jgi:hypothetical protein
MRDDTTLYDVLAVNIETREERVMATGLTAGNADACVAMAVMRRGVDVEFFKAVPSSEGGVK